MTPRKNSWTIVALFCLVGSLATGVALADGGQRYAVTVTNLTRGQILSPPVVVAHKSSIGLFTPGQPASPELAQLAEDAVSGPLLALLGTLPEVNDANIAGGVVPPGQSVTVEIEVAGAFRTISTVGMLVTTNDAFFAASGTALPAGQPSTVAAIAWDAGSEANTEACAHIPGPPCGNPLVRVTEGAEGYVHVHAGITGGGDLVGADHDWNNPVAYVTIRRLD